VNPVLVFDIETVPDIAGIRKLQGIDAAVSDHDVAEMAFQLRRQTHGNDFLPHHLQRVLVISCVLQDRDHFKV
jgi:3'-5' exonuclease